MRTSAVIAVVCAAAAVYYAVTTTNPASEKVESIPKQAETAATNSDGVKIWTTEELSKYDGSDDSLPLMLVILGEVFDVTAGKQHYGQGQGYNIFVGWDASRAFISGEFDRTKTYDPPLWDVTSMKSDELLGIDDWKKFYSGDGDGAKYTFEGLLYTEDGYYDRTGKKTPKLLLVEDQIKDGYAKAAKEKEYLKVYPSCNSKYEQGKGSWVWCENDKLPRLGQLEWDRNERCGCYTRMYASEHSDKLRTYLDCPPEATKCTLTTA